MKRIAKAVAVLVCSAAMLAVAAAQEKKDQIDVTGTWLMQVQTGAGGGTPTFTFKQIGEKLEGEYTGTFGTAKVAGTVKGNVVSFWIDVDVQGTALHVKYDGTAEQDSMKGTVSLGDLGEGTFTGSRKK